ncbi:MAG TPA: cell division protein FtsB [Gammaproteobacteria bacterium]|nr:cell division protein FtsB [Gammaproteobacteria bacterium]
MSLKWLVGALLIFVIVIQFNLWIGNGSLAEVWGLREEVSRQQQINEQLLQRNQILYAEVEDLRHGTEAVEARARMELGMVKQGEEFYQFIQPNLGKK